MSIRWAARRLRRRDRRRRDRRLVRRKNAPQMYGTSKRSPILHLRRRDLSVGALHWHSDRFTRRLGRVKRRPQSLADPSTSVTRQLALIVIRLIVRSSRGRFDGSRGDFWRSLVSGSVFDSSAHFCFGANQGVGFPSEASKRPRESRDIVLQVLQERFKFMAVVRAVVSRVPAAGDAQHGARLRHVRQLLGRRAPDGQLAADGCRRDQSASVQPVYNQAMTPFLQGTLARPHGPHLLIITCKVLLVATCKLNF